MTGSDDDTARLWDAETGQEVRQFVGHTDQVSSSLSEKSDFPNKDNLDVKYGHDQKIQNR